MAETTPSEPPAQRSIVIFGPQGSSDIFEQQALDQALADVAESSLASTLLARCYSAFVQDLEQIQRYDNIDLRSPPTTPNGLLSFPTLASTHPLIEASRLCLFQLLRFVRATTTSTSDPSLWPSLLSDVTECCGFSSGIIPAAAIAAASDADELLAYGVGAFRLAFWVGYRNWTWCKAVGLECSGGDSCSLAIKSAENAIEGLAKSLQVPLAEFTPAGTADNNWVTLTDTPKNLRQVQTLCTDQWNSSATFLHIHGLYHAGDALKDLVVQIRDDVKTHNVDFPDFQHLKRSLRSSQDGLCLSSSGSLVESVLTNLLVDPFNWSITSASIAARIDTLLEQQPHTTISLICIGPSSGVSSSGIRKRVTKSSPNFVIKDVWLSALPRPSTFTTASDDDIAIVGMAIDMPQASTTSELWDLIREGRSTATEIPMSRFDASAYLGTTSDDSKATRSMSTKYGNFLEDIWGLDQAFFKISHREARSMDPQQKTLLRVTKAALEDAGYVEDSTPSYQRETMGCYIGAATGDYTDNLTNDIDVYYIPGTLRAFLSGKLSYQYKLSGPSLVVDTACSSSAVAIYQACRALRNKDCTVAIAGGVNTISSPDMYLGLDRGHFLSPSGQCKPFDVRADGYCRAEGCGAFVLKSVSSAIADNDRVHAVIRGVEVNQSGCSQSITHPDADTQATLLRHLLNRANVDPATVQVVEAHGTGTQAGDKTELRGLHDVFSKVKRRDPVLVSSVKGNIGHCEAASGSAGLAKLLLMLRHGEIPMQASLTTINPSLAHYIGGAIAIPRAMMPWQRNSNRPRRAVLNNFGAAGSNAALLLEEYIAPTTINIDSSALRSAYPFVVSARSSKALVKLKDSYHDFLATTTDGRELADICYTATARRHRYEYTSCFAGSSIEQVMAQMLDLDTTPITGSSDSAGLFVFSGQGAAHHGMARELSLTSPLFRRVVQECGVSLRSLGVAGVAEFLSGEKRVLHGDNNADQIVVTQCACIVLQYALSKLWASWKVIPQAVIGHSLGEYAALAVAGVLSIEDCLRLTATRAQLMVEHCTSQSSGMLACRLPASDVETMLRTSSDWAVIEIVCQNSPEDCVLGGPLERLKAFANEHQSDERKMTLLEVPYAFHSSAMDPLLEPLRHLAKSIKMSTPTTPIYSTVLGRQAYKADLDTSYLVSHTRQPVLLTKAVQALNADLPDSRFVIEVGPHPSTIPMITKSWNPPRSESLMLLPSLRKSTDSWVTLSKSISLLAPVVEQIDWRTLFDGTGARLIDLPGHPLFPDESGIGYAEHGVPEDMLSSPRHNRHAFALRAVTPSQNAGRAYTTKVRLMSKYIEGHRVGGTAICPASVYYELVLEAVHLMQEPGKDEVWTVKDVQFAQALTHRGSIDDTKTVEVALVSHTSENLSFQVLAGDHESSRRNLCCQGALELIYLSKIQSKWLRQQALVKRQREQFSRNSPATSFDCIHKTLLYDTVFARVVDYSSDYHSIQDLAISLNGSEGYGTVRFPSQAENLVVPPVVSDTLLHSCGFIANSHSDLGDVYICGRLESLTVLYHQLELDAEYKIYCTLLRPARDLILADAFLINHNDQIIAAAEGIEFKRVRLASFQASLSRLDNKSPESSTPPKVDSKFGDSQIATPIGVSSPGGPLMVTQSIKQLVAETCHMPVVHLDLMRSLDELGFDSMMLLELRAGVEKLFPSGKFPTQQLRASATLGELIESIELDNNSGSATPAVIGSEEDAASPSDGRRGSGHADTGSPISILAHLCGADPTTMRLQDPLDSFGIDSMMMLELQDILSRQWGVDVPSERLSACVNIADLEGIVSRSIQQPTTTMSESLPQPTLLQTGAKEATPVYLFHDGSGMCSMYKALGNIGRQLWGFANIHDRHTAAGIVEMAHDYTASILSHGNKRVLLGGWSFGGVVAFETARQLISQGCVVEGVVLIDSPCPVDHAELPEPVIQYIMKTMLPGELDRNSVAHTLVSSRFHQHTAMLATYAPSGRSTARPKIAMLRSRDVIDTKKLCGVDYPWLSDQSFRAGDARKWQQFSHANLVFTYDIPGSHFEPFAESNILDTTRYLRQALDRLSRS